MEIKEIISSGLIEMYCMGLAYADEIKLIEKFASQSKEVKDEIASVHESLNQYALASSQNPSPLLKNKIISYILNAKRKNQPFQFPPRLTSYSTISELLNYILRIISPRRKITMKFF